MQKIQNYINGILVAPQNNEYLDNFEPATGKIYSLIAKSNQQDLNQAVKSAEKAQIAWANTRAEEKARILTKIADLIDENAAELAKAEAIDNGKPISLAKNVDISRAAANMRFFAHACTQFSSESHSMENRGINYTLRDPIGIVACISPWNLPLYLFTWKIAPALASGNVVIAKPSEVTPMTSYLFAKLCIKAGLPKGVLSILHGTGSEIGAAIVAHRKIKAISFTGGTSTGAHIAAATAGMFKKLSLELGGKNPSIVFADCDFEQAVKTVAKAAFANQGQICLCGSRIYIEQNIYTKFKAAFIKQVSALKIGDPLDESTEYGALVSQQHQQKVMDYIKLAQSEGGKILTGGQEIKLKGRCKNGYFIQPTVIENLSNSCRTNQEEIFGPVCTLMPFTDEKQVLEHANASEYGLAASIWTNDLKRAHRMAKNIEAGIVWLNCWLMRDLRTPFGGMKSSGVGREGGMEALRLLTETKNVCLKY